MRGMMIDYRTILSRGDGDVTIRRGVYGVVTEALELQKKEEERRGRLRD